MIEDFNILIESIARLPDFAAYMVAFFFVYKVVIIGSVYGLIRYLGMRLFNYLEYRKVEYKEIRPMLDGMCIKAETDKLIAQLYRLRGVSYTTDLRFIHANDIDWLREAIDEKLLKDKAK